MSSDNDTQAKQRKFSDEARTRRAKQILDKIERDVDDRSFNLHRQRDALNDERLRLQKIEAAFPSRAKVLEADQAERERKEIARLRAELAERDAEIAKAESEMQPCLRIRDACRKALDGWFAKYPRLKRPTLSDIPYAGSASGVRFAR